MISDARRAARELARKRRRLLRAKFAEPCQRCLELRPDGRPTKLLPQQTCSVDGYTDTRPRLTEDQIKELS